MSNNGILVVQVMGKWIVDAFLFSSRMGLGSEWCMKYESWVLVITVYNVQGGQISCLDLRDKGRIDKLVV